MASFLDGIINSVSPIATRLAQQFNLTPAAPAPAPAVAPAPPIPVVAPPVAAPPATPIANDLYQRFLAPAPPKPNSFLDAYAGESAARIAGIKANLSPFEKTLSDTGSNIIHSATGAIGSFLGTNTRNVEDFATGKLTLHPDDWVSGLAKTGIGTLDLTGKLAQGFNQSILRIGTSVGDVVPGFRQAREASGPSSLLESITGSPVSDTYQDVFKGSGQWALQKGATPTGATAFAGFATLGTMFMDDPGIGPEAKTAFTLSKGALGDIVKTTDHAAVKAIILQENPKISPKLADFITPLFADTSTSDEAAQILKFVQGSAKTASDAVEKKAIIEQGKQGYTPPAELTPEEIATQSGRFNTPEIQAARQATQEGVPTTGIDTEERNALRNSLVHETYGSGATRQDKRLDLVIGAPASGKSTLVEDLAREHGAIVPDADAIKKQLPEYGLTGQGSQLVHGESVAIAAQVRRLARERGDNTILQMIGHDAKQIERNIQIYHDAGYDIHLHHVELAPEKAAERAVARYKAGGHFIDPEFILKEVGLKPSQAYDIVKNDARLTSFEKLSNDVRQGERPISVESGGKSARKESERLGRDSNSSRQSPPKNYRTQEVSPNLVRTLGQAKDPYEVLNILKNEFPNLPDRVVDKIVDRFTHTKRISNVENLIRSARHLDEQFKPGGAIQVAEKGTKLDLLKPLKTESEKAAKVGSEKNLPKSSKEVLDKTVNPTVRKLMRQDQKIEYIKTIKDKFEDPKQAVIAAHEYDRIWDDLNQKVVDEYENLSMHKSFIEDTLANDNAATLFNKYYKRSKLDPADPTVALRELMDSAQNKAKARRKFDSGRGARKPAQLTAVEERRLHLDTEIEALGYKDFDEAQIALERYATMRAEAKDLGSQLRELKPRVKEARILQGALDDIAVVPREHVRAIDKLATQSNVRDSFKDISGFAGQARDLTRNFEHFFGKKYAEVKKAVLDPFDEAKGRFVDENKKLADSLDTDVVKKFGFRRGSKESAAIQRFGDIDLKEGERMSEEDLVKEFGKNKAAKIVEADKWFRGQYDRLIDELNAVRKKIYPNSPSKLIAKRANYYRHFREMNDTWGDALREFFDTPAGIDPRLAGLSEFTKAKSRFLPFAEKRLSQSTQLDAIGGFIDYIPMFSYAKEIDPQVSVFRYLRSKLAEVAPRAGEELKMENGKTFKSKGAENFVGYLDDFTRDLTGNTNPLDRYIQKMIPGGRKTIRAGRFINSRMKANTVGGNLGSALAQIANVPAGLADAGPINFTKGIQRTLAGTVNKNEAMAKSLFMKERYAQSANERFPFQFKDKPLKASGDLARKQAGWIMTQADKVGTSLIWNSEYEKGLAKGVEDAVRFADDKTRKLVAGRGIGEVPLAQKALTTQFIAPFTLEVANAWWIMKDWVSKKEFASLATFFLANYVLNEVSERVRGSRITLDPINALVQGTQSLVNEWKGGNIKRGGIKLLGRLAGEVLANIPYGQTLAALTPDSGVQAATQALTGAPMTKQDVFGQSQVSGRFGTPLIVSGLGDAVYRLLPPVGGLQLKKTISGITALIKGHAEDSKGGATFDVKATPGNVAKALMFGANATSESKQYFDSRQDLFDRISSQTANTFVRNATAEDDWSQMKKLIASGKKKEAGDLLASIASKDKLQAQAIARIAAQEKQGLNSNDRLVGMLNVENGERAKYIVGQMKKMKTGPERAAYVADLAKKKLITKQVVQQITLLYGAKTQ